MAIEEVIYSRLSGFAGLSALVASRIYPNVMPQDVTLPAVSYRRVTADRPQPQPTPDTTDLVRARFQFDAWANSYAAARNVREQIRQALLRWSASGPPEVQVAFFVSEIDLYEDNTGLHHLSADYEINYNEV